MNNEFERIIKSIKRHEMIIYITGYALVFASAFITRGYIESLASFLFLSGVILNTKRVRAWFIASSLGMLIYSYIAFQNHFYSELLINLLYMLPMQIYGFISWGKSKQKHTTFEIISFDFKKMLIIFAVSSVAAALYGFLLTFINNESPYLCACATVCSAVAVMLAARKATQQFLFWVGNNVCLVLMWSQQVLGNISVMSLVLVNFIFIVTNLLGLHNWLKMQKNMIETNRE